MNDLRFLDPEALVNRAAFNERFEQLNNAVFNNGGTLEDILGNAVGVQIETGSYVGDGSISKTVVLTGTPKLFFLSTENPGMQNRIIWSLGVTTMDLGPNSDYATNFEATESGLTISGNKRSISAFNYSGTKYYYTAIV